MGKVQEAEFDAEVDRVVAEIVDWKVEGDKAEKKVKMLKNQLKTRIVSEMGDEKDIERVSEVGQTVYKTEEMQVLAETVRDALTGGSAMVPGSGDENWRDELAENVKDLRKKRGI